VLRQHCDIHSLVMCIARLTKCAHVSQGIVTRSPGTLFVYVKRLQQQQHARNYFSVSADWIFVSSLMANANELYAFVYNDTQNN